MLSIKFEYLPPFVIKISSATSKPSFKARVYGISKYTQHSDVVCRWWWSLSQDNRIQEKKAVFWLDLHLEGDNIHSSRFEGIAWLENIS